MPFETPIFGLFEHKIGVFVLGVPLSAASGRVIADIFEILHGSGRGRVEYGSLGRQGFCYDWLDWG